LRRAESFLGVHFDFHAGKDCREIGKNGHGSKQGYSLVGPLLANGRIEDGHATSAAPTIGTRNQLKLNHAKKAIDMAGR
jgi:hypothetical protein